MYFTRNECNSSKNTLRTLFYLSLSFNMNEKHSRAALKAPILVIVIAASNKVHTTHRIALLTSRLFSGAERKSNRRRGSNFASVTSHLNSENFRVEFFFSWVAPNHLLLIILPLQNRKTRNTGALALVISPHAAEEIHFDVDPDHKNFLLSER